MLKELACRSLLFLLSLALTFFQGSGGIVLGIGFGRDEGVGGLVPGEEVVEEFIALGGIRRGEVGALADVVREVVEFRGVVGGEFFAATVELPFFEEEVEFPIALADDADGAASETGFHIEIATANDGAVEVAGEVPEDGLSLQLALAFEQRQETFAIEHLVGGGTCGGEEGGKEIDIDDGAVADAAGFHDTRPTDDHGLADAAFVVAALAAAQGFLGGLLGGAVVAGENEEGVLLDTEFFQAFDQHADAGIEVVGAGGVHAIALREFGMFLGEVVERFLAALQRAVNGVVGEVAEEGAVLVGLDELQRLPRQREDALGIVGWPGLVAFRSFLEFAFAEGIKGQVETLDAGFGTAGTVEVPLANVASGVTSRFQRIRHRDVLLGEPPLVRDGDQPVLGLVATIRAADSIDMVARGVGAGEQAGAAGGAVSGGGVGVRENHAFLREGIEVGRFTKSAALVADVLPSEVIGEDENDVGLGRCEEGSAEQAGKEESGEEELHGGWMGTSGAGGIFPVDAVLDAGRGPGLLGALLMMITRFAPSPTGWLHLGHAYAALIAEQRAVEAGGRYLVRLEDLDLTRVRPEYEAGIFEDLLWLGQAWEKPVWRQSERFEVYREALGKLEALGLLYPCFCTRREIADEIERAGAAPQGPDGPLYPGICRAIDEETRGRRINEGVPYALRFDVAKAATMVERPLVWRDRQRGEVEANPGIFGDVVLARKDTPASYHLSVVIDDAAQGVTLVTRGEDLFLATHLHRLLQELLGLPVPEWEHHRLILDEEGRRLAKRDAARSLRSLRDSGWTPDDVRERLGLA